MLRMPNGRPRSRREVVPSVLVVAALASYVVLVYLVLVVGGGALVGQTSSPGVVLSVVATAVVALSLGRVQGWVERRVARLMHGGQAAPQDILRRFSEAATGIFPAEELPSRMARLLAEGVGAERAEVWLAVDGRLDLAAAWPDDGVVDDRVSPDGTRGRRSREVRQAGELLGALVVQEREGVVLTPVEERLFAGLADQAGLVFRGVRLRAELSRRATDLSVLEEELRESLERLVDAHDAERHRLERDIHDGAQQHLVALAVNLRLAQTLLPRSPERADQILADQDRAVADTIDTLAGLSRGIYPRALTEGGLVAALEAARGNSPVRVTLTAEQVGRLPAQVESAAYFGTAEALQNAAKHSSATVIRVTVGIESDVLCVVVEDDGVGFDPATTATGSGLANIQDRVEAVGGGVTIASLPGRTQVTLRIPVASTPAEAVH